MNSTKDLLMYFVTEWEHKHKASYPIAWGRDMAIIARLRKVYSTITLTQYIGFYLSEFQSDFVAKQGYPLTLLSTSLPAIIAQLSKHKSTLASSDHPDYHKIQEARKKLSIK